MATALYRKYRPAVFSDVIGQNHITGTLINQIERDRVGHGYLFTGSRGTGKTTCAKIFARAINCLTPDNGSPCGKCSVCKALSEPGNIDILEIDAASNNGVDNIREIRERVKYPPVHGKYKVYIIDEVHMLSGSAFNAFLKTLEEPPAHVVFVLATTEAHKLPATILSRCMRFDFRLVGLNELIAHIKGVYEKENRAAEDEAIEYIAKAADGSVRDALSIADMCLDYPSKVLSASDVRDVLGAADRAQISALFDALKNSDYGDAFVKVDEMSAAGKSMGLIAGELTAYARDLLVLKTGNASLVTDTRERIKIMQEYAETVSVELLISIIQIFSAISAELRYSVNPRIVIETACIRAAKLAVSDISALEERIFRLESGGVRAPAAPDSPRPTLQAAAPSNSGSVSKDMSPRAVWGRILTFMRKNETMRLHSLIGGQTDYDVAGGKLVIRADAEEFLELSDDETIAALGRAISHDGIDLEVVIEKRAASLDMDAEIEKLRKISGDAKVNVKRF